MNSNKLIEKFALLLEALISLAGTLFLFKANVFLFIRNAPLIDNTWLWALLSSSILLGMLFVNSKDLVSSLKDVGTTKAVSKLTVFVNLSLIAFMVITFQEMVLYEYFAPVGAYESVFWALLAGMLCYSAKLLIDSIRLLLSGKQTGFMTRFYALFAAFFMVHGLWIVTQDNFHFTRITDRVSVASLLVDELSPGDRFLGHKAYVLGSTDAPYGYLVYESEGRQANEKLPLLIFLHGGDETGNSERQHVALRSVAKHGPSRYIKNGQWNPPTPMIVVSPQTTDGWWRPKMLHAFIEYLIDHYPVDKSRIYLTGLSRGGTGSFDYINYYGDASYVAAMLPLATDSIVRNSGEFVPENFKNTPIWLFVNDNDKYVADVGVTAGILQAANTRNNDSHITVFPRHGHDTWTPVYTMRGQGQELPDFDPYDMNVFEWLLQFDKHQ